MRDLKQLMERGSSWNPGTVIVAPIGGPPERRDGYIHKGLALIHDGWATPRTATMWALVHIGSGCAVIGMTGDLRTVMPVAGQIADCTDWTLFDMHDGWQQTDPELPAKLQAIVHANLQATPRWGRLDDAEQSRDAVRAVIAMREGL